MATTDLIAEIDQNLSNFWTNKNALIDLKKNRADLEGSLRAFSYKIMPVINQAITNLKPSGVEVADIYRVFQWPLVTGEEYTYDWVKKQPWSWFDVGHEYAKWLIFENKYGPQDDKLAQAWQTFYSALVSKGVTNIPDKNVWWPLMGESRFIQYALIHSYFQESWIQDALDKAKAILQQDFPIYDDILLNTVPEKRAAISKPDGSLWIWNTASDYINLFGIDIPYKTPVPQVSIAPVIEKPVQVSTPLEVKDIGPTVSITTSADEQSRAWYASHPESVASSVPDIVAIPVPAQQVPSPKSQGPVSVSSIMMSDGLTSEPTKGTSEKTSPIMLAALAVGALFLFGGRD